MANWDVRFLELALHIAQWSKDPSTKVGAVLVGRRKTQVTVGYNGFPPGIADTPERLQNRDVKYLLVQHAERNVLDNAEFDTYGSSLYTTFPPCPDCAKSIITMGVSRVVCIHSDRPDWQERFGWSHSILKEAGIELSPYRRREDGVLEPMVMSVMYLGNQKVDLAQRGKNV